MIGHQQVFFLDRISRGTLTLAKSAREQGALVVFEPSGMGEPRLFREAWSVAHVVKYANNRLRDITDLDLECEVRDDLLLEIETLGASGLRYRSRLSDSGASGWNTLQVIAPPRLRDAAGAGDWCTAGVLHKLARGGLAGFRRVGEERLVHALRYGQALATWGCAFESARGGMYQVTRQRFDRQVRALFERGGVQTTGRLTVTKCLRTLGDCARLARSFPISRQANLKRRDSRDADLTSTSSGSIEVESI